jgi:hypothetical protein
MNDIAIGLLPDIEKMVNTEPLFQARTIKMSEREWLFLCGV